MFCDHTLSLQDALPMPCLPAHILSLQDALPMPCLPAHGSAGQVFAGAGYAVEFSHRSGRDLVDMGFDQVHAAVRL